MISPEVVDFSAPKNLLQSYTIKNDQVLDKLFSEDLGNHHFHEITAIFPCEISTQVQECISDSIYYQVDKFPVYKLLESNFFSAFIRNGHLHARTIGTWRNVDQSVVLESGKLHLSVERDVYQELGLTGTPELILTRHGASKYRVTINLLDEKFLSEDSKYKQRIVWCLKKHINLQFDWIMAWNPQDLDICPSSLAAYIDSLGFRVVQCNPSVIEISKNHVKIPLLSPLTDLLDMIEWTGTAALNIECSEQENYTSSLSCPQPNSISEVVHILKWKGFFSVAQAKRLFTVMRLFSQEAAESNVPWLNLTLHGFEDLPSGHSTCSFFINPLGHCQVFTSQTTYNKVK